MKQSTLSAVIAAMAVVLVAYVLYSLYRYAIDSPLRIDAKVAKDMIRKHAFDIILDVRTDFEVKTLGSFPAAVHIPSSEIESSIEAIIPDKQSRVLLYCNTGQRARKAAEKMNALGYKYVRYIATQYTTLL